MRNRTGPWAVVALALGFGLGGVAHAVSTTQPMNDPTTPTSMFPTKPKP